MLLPRIGHLLSLKNLEVLTESATSFSGFNDIINESSLSSHQRSGEVVGLLILVLGEGLAT